MGSEDMKMRPKITWLHSGGIVLESLRIFWLRIVTVGLYSFWGRARIRRRIWSSVSLEGQPFEYTGTGKELFIGFLVAIGVFLLPLYSCVIAIMLIYGDQHPLTIMAHVVFLLLLLYLFGVSRYRARRYRLSRTSWRGIQGGMEGSALAFGWTYFWTALLVPLTFGWIIPWRTAKLQGILVNGTRLGSEVLSFDGKARPLYPGFAIFWVGSLLVYVSFFVTLGIAFSQERALFPGKDGVASPATLALLVLAGLTVVFLYSLLSAFYYSRLYNHFAHHTRIQGARFLLETTVPSLMRLYAENFFIRILSLGILTPVVQWRQARYLTQRLSLPGTLEYEKIKQNPAFQEKGEKGLADMLDIDAY